jgi:lipopolysaccharide transport system permease protein
MSALRALWSYRGFIRGSVKREFQTKYRNSMLGVAWIIFNPLAMILVYTVVFSQVMSSKLPGIDSIFAYSIYLCVGILSWGLFSEIVSRSLNMFLDNANMLKKLNFPRICIPAIVLLNAGLNFLIIFGLFTLFLLVTGNFPGLIYLAILPLLFVLIVFGLGLGITLGVLNVFFRDVGQLFGIFFQFWFWLTPIVYPVNAIPTSFQPLISWNPMTPIIQGFQMIFVQRKLPDCFPILYVFLVAIAVCLLGIYVFRKRVGEMVDEL